MEKKSRPLTPAQEMLREAKQVETVRRTVANLCCSVLEQPEQNIDKVGELLRVFENEAHMAIPEARRLIALSTCELFSDILPSYRIRSLTDKEKAQRIKKETRKLQMFEEKLLTHYKKFTTILAKFIRGQVLHVGKSKAEVRPNDLDHKTGVKCAAALLRSQPNFNHAEDLMKMLIPVLNQKPEALKSKLRSSALAATSDALQALLREDRVGQPSLLLVRGLVQFAQSQRFVVAPGLLNVLLAVNVREVAPTGETKRLSYKERQAQWSRKQRKVDKQNLKFQRQMEETRASQSRDARLQLNSKIIAQVFFLYFKILQLQEKIRPDLLSAVLAGLSKHAHLLSVEYFDDLFAIIAGLLENKTLSPADGLACVHTAMVVLCGDGAALQVDSRRFYSHLYAQILPAVSRTSGPPAALLLDCLELMLVQRRREVSSERALAFVKRLATAALLASPPDVALALLDSLHRLLRLDSRLAPVLLDADSDKGQGVFSPDAPEPEMANAATATLWELHGLRRHASLDVRRRADQALSASAAPASQPAQPPSGGAQACVAAAEAALQAPELQRWVRAAADGTEGRRKRKRKAGAPVPEWLQRKMRRLELTVPELAR